MRAVTQHLDGLDMRVEQRMIGARDIDEQHLAAWLEHPPHFGERARHVVPVMRAHPADHPVERISSNGNVSAAPCCVRMLARPRSFAAPSTVASICGAMSYATTS